ncbi:phosphoenolpyruvate synthase [Pseudoalteromonas sp. NBT06-2]|uniref:PEP/pyruvate-binding domain-containing protein n=1 Tax=Pseudoalteromonas sp. NBT06-2 TaxID=2025950 RepID=UPI000BA5C54C|nr:PEP/pyruvate-binding domain-containing protein [Pseudoalteromonas sp. NBT06-2]PAJ72893.1 phosphoenolpyruvate synthase [Pseudoalteromonas sp. NBT06-2]
MTNKNLVIEVTGCNDNDINELGGKAYSLNQMLKAGSPVPRAFCITVPAYDLFVDQIDMINVQDKNYTEIKRKIDSSDIPDAIKVCIEEAYQSLGNNKSVAIRSSAIGEDSKSQSFAGQYQTYLHISGLDNVLDKVKACWSSLWDEGAKAYSQSTDVNKYEKKGIAVIIQEMIDADCAGVLFTQDPVNDQNNTMIIDACWGLGEGVVSGQVLTDTFEVDKRDLSIRNTVVRRKNKQSGLDSENEIKLLDIAEAKKEQACMSNGQLMALSLKAKELVKHYGTELDIEWAFKDNRLWLLQARPITSAAQPKLIYANPWDKDKKNKNNAMFSRMDTGEIVTGLMTPLGLSFCEFYQKQIHGPAIKTMGLLDEGKSENYMGYIQGHVYLNISASASLLRQCPPTRDEMKFTKRYATSELDFTGYKNPYGSGVTGFSYFKSAMYWLKGQVINTFSAEKLVKKMITLREHETKRFSQLNLSAMSLAELNNELERIDGYFLDSCAVYMPFFLQSFALYDALTEACEKYLSDKGAGLQNRIKASMNNLRTIEVTRGIVNLVVKVKQQPILLDLFNKHDASALLAILPVDDDSKQFWHLDFKNFLSDFGSRGRQEFELSIPRWSDDPTYLLQVMKMYLENDIDLEQRLTTIGNLREHDTESLLKNLPFFAKFKIRFLTKIYGVMAERREATRPTFIAETWFYRRIIVEVLKRLSKKNIVTVDQLPFINFNAFRDYVAGRVSAEQAFTTELLEKNRHQHLLNLHAQEPPMAIIGGYEPKMRVEEVHANKSLLNGLAASPGQVIAKARVITNLQQQASEFKKGEILVTKYTDASWTPLFILAAGVVTDIGSALSHSSIVAREFGIPAIVNLKYATTQIETGDLLIIDGDKGTVQIK